MENSRGAAEWVVNKITALLSKFVETIWSIIVKKRTAFSGMHFF